jgi:hypothetical protein
MSVTTTTPSPSSTASAASQISARARGAVIFGPDGDRDHRRLGAHHMLGGTLQFGREPPMCNDDDPDHL